MKGINKVILNNIANVALWFLALALVLELLLWLPWSEVLKWVIVMLPVFVFSVLILSAIDYYINRRIVAKRPADIRMDVIARISSGEIDMNKMQKYTPEEAQVMARFTQEELERLTNAYKNKGEIK